MTNDQQHHLGQLGLMLKFEQMVVNRVGAPGCAARLKAADNVLALTWAIETLRPMATPPTSVPLTMDDACRNAGKGNLTP